MIRVRDTLQQQRVDEAAGEADAHPHARLRDGIEIRGHPVVEGTVEVRQAQ